MIRRAITDLPPDVQTEHFEAAETIMVEAARRNDPQRLMVAAHDLVNKLEQLMGNPAEVK